MPKNNEEPEKPKPKRVIVEFEHISFILQDFTRIKRGFQTTKTNKTGILFTMTLYMASHPFTETFKYESEDERNKSYNDLCGTLERYGIIFDTAKPMLNKAIKEDSDDYSDDQMI